METKMYVERGQLIIIGGVALALILVSLALLLNSLIYTENLANRDTSSDIRDVPLVRQEIAEMMNGSIAYVNRNNNTSHEALRSNLTAVLSDAEQRSQHQKANRGIFIDVSMVSVTNRTEVVHDNSSRNFTNVSGMEDWTLGSGINEVQDYEMHVYSEDLTRMTDTGDPFWVIATDGSRTWKMKVRNDSSANEINVTVIDGDGNPDPEWCTASGDDVWINITDGTVGGTDCSALNFPGDVTSPYTLKYKNAHNVSGTYELTAITTKPVETAHYNTTGGSPRATYAINTTTVDLTYDSTIVSYSGTITVHAES